MRFLLCLIIPWLGFFTIGRPITGGYMPNIAIYTYWMASCFDMGYLLSWSVQNRQKN